LTIETDINDKRGTALVEEICKSTQNQNHHYIHCDVTDWQSQVNFFHKAIEISATGGIDAVVANAGTTDAQSTFEQPKGLDANTPPRPNLLAFNVNMIGVLYTTQLAIFYLPRNPRSENASPSSNPGEQGRDRHLLLIGSMASLGPLPGGALYTASKHGVLGLFRSLRSTAFFKGIRVNMLCPYYIDTPLIPTEGRLMLAGAAMGKPEDVVEAGTRLMADTRIVGRALVVGPKVKAKLDDKGMLVPDLIKDGKESAVWEAYADDWEEADVFATRFIRMLNLVQTARGKAGALSDLAKAAIRPLMGLFRR
jgi:NAD(P)-dependent dehydrogenase (short-subunit alcohol dehydrogenase family)